MTPDQIAAEFEDADLGDKRLDLRLVDVATRIAGNPGASFPKVFPNEADLEGFYRLIRNDRLTVDTVLEPHVQSTVDRAHNCDSVLAIHDTTDFKFSGERKNLGRLRRAGHGFLGHFTLLAMTGEVSDPLGVVALHTWKRTGESATAKRHKGKLTYEESRRLNTEQKRWGRQVDEAERRVGDAASLIHVMDSEADDYALLAKLCRDSRRFVVRLCYDRLLDMKALGSAPNRKTKAFLAKSVAVCTRTVSLSPRGRRPGGGKRKVRMKTRRARKATLEISATPVVFRRPNSTSKNVSKTLAVNVVQVREANAPEDAEPVEWLLITTEPILEEEDILKIIDYYRGRWLIEEYFKSLKTGCSYEKRQLESMKTLCVALAVLVPVAWSLLRLRTVARNAADAPVDVVLTPTQLDVLRLASATPLSRKVTAQDAMLAIAKLGGHLRRNGEPGWQILGRGYQELLLLTQGYVLARQKM